MSVPGLTAIHGGHTVTMREPDDLWREVTLSVLADTDADLRDEAAEFHRVEAARCRVVDRRGQVKVILANGCVLAGERQAWPAIVDAITLRVSPEEIGIVPVAAVDEVTGSMPSLRDEEGREQSLASVLREHWAAGSRVRVLRRDRRWQSGTLVFVGADHIELDTTDGALVLPFTAVLAWGVPG